MKVNLVHAVVHAGLACAWAATSIPVAAQDVYRCGASSYSQVPCSRRIVNTHDAPVPPVHAEPNRLLAQATRRLPGESSAGFATRRHRAAMLPTDRDECARLDTRMPFEKARMSSPREDEIDDAQAALAESRKRYRQLKC